MELTSWPARGPEPRLHGGQLARKQHGQPHVDRGMVLEADWLGAQLDHKSGGSHQAGIGSSRSPGSSLRRLWTIRQNRSSINQGLSMCLARSQGLYTYAYGPWCPQPVTLDATIHAYDW